MCCGVACERNCASREWRPSGDQQRSQKSAKLEKLKGRHVNKWVAPAAFTDALTSTHDCATRNVLLRVLFRLRQRKDKIAADEVQLQV